MKKVRDFLVVSALGVLVVNLTLISAVILIVNYGSATLYPGENYTVNFPFFGISMAPTICGKAEKTNGEGLGGINVSVYYYQGDFIENAITNSDGTYCITLPEITTGRKYDIFVEYDNETPEPITLGSNDYDLNFLNNLVFSKSLDGYAILQGTIENEDAEIENGRFQINLQYWPANSSERYEIFDYQKYAVNIEPGESYDVPSEELNVSWQIPADADTGKYKFYIKSSFNAKERTSSIYFNVTA